MTLKKSLMIIFILITILTLTGCGVPEIDSETIPDEESIAEEIQEELPDHISFWGFDGGDFEGWEHSPGWSVENGFARSSSQGQGFFTHEEWQDFHLFSGIEIQSDSVLAVHFRETEFGGYQILVEPEHIALLAVFDGNVEELIGQTVANHSGRFELGVNVVGPLMTVDLNGERLFEYGDLEYLEPGHFGVMNLNAGLVKVDYVEVHELTPSGDDETPEYVVPAMGELVIPEPPVAEKIGISVPGVSFYYPIIGEPGAVFPGSLVSIANLETARVKFLTANQDGSFETEIFAFPGTSIQVKHLNADEGFHQMLRDQEDPGEIILGEHTAATGTIIRVPDLIEYGQGEIPIAVGGWFIPDTNFYWHLSGTMIVLNSDPQDFQIGLSGKVFITSEDDEPIPSLDTVAGIGFTLERHFDQQGNQEVRNGFYVSDIFSPTGFPIYTGESLEGVIAGFIPLTDWQQIDEQTYQAEFEYDFKNEQGLPIQPGYYGLLIHGGLHEHLLSDMGPLPQQVGPSMRSGVVYGPGGHYSPLFRLGEPDQPHLFWGLLTDVLHEATRGTVTREDLDRAGFMTMISQQSRKYLLPMDDQRTGEKIQYRLEPSLPYLSHGDRGLPGPPTIDLDISSSELTVIVKCPDGRIDELGPIPFTQSFNATPSYPNGVVLDYTMGGGSFQDVYQLTTLNDAFSYTFDQYGHHEIEMTGWVEDIIGNRFSGGGIYDVYVAKPLKLYNGVLPSTPFIEGDAFSPSLQVYPRVPADIEIDLTILPNSSWEKAIEHQISGRANEYGYFLPAYETPIRFTNGGEYRADVTAQYTDNEGVLWMGSASWGSLIENRDTKLIAHGMRGLDTKEVNNLWFFHQNLGIDGVFHTLFPYFSGDIFWGHEVDILPPGLVSPGADAIIPGISMEDTTGDIYQLLRENFDTKSHSYIPGYEGGFESAIDVGEVFPFITTSTGNNPHLFPDQIDQYGYAYQSSQRPGARVHESLAEGNNPLAYWRYGSTYGKQVGTEGDLPNDIKWQFGGVVFRDESRNIHEYAAYSSFWVLIPQNDPIGARVTPPFQGATGGPNGGPIMTIKGEEIDLLFLPRSGFPGQVLEIGDTLSFSGFVGPPLNSKLTIQVTSPSGEKRIISGQANRIGYFYQPEDDFIVHEPGVWTVDLEVLHDGMTSSGPTMEPYPTGTALGAMEGSYQIYVTSPDTPKAQLTSHGAGFVAITEELPPITFKGVVPEDFSDADFTYTIRMPGVILEQGEGSTSGNTFSMVYDPLRLSQDFPNIDLMAMEGFRAGLADQIWITILFDKDGRYLPFTITLHGEEVFYR